MLHLSSLSSRGAWPFRRWVGALLAALLAASACPGARAADYILQQELTAVASGEGAPSGVFGFSVAVDDGIAVAADLGIPTRPARVRTYLRSGNAWSREADGDIEIPGDSSAQLALREGTLALTAFDSNTDRSYVQIFERGAAGGWTMSYSLSTTQAYFNSVATSAGYIVAIGEPYYNQNRGRVRILRRSGSSWNQTLLQPGTPEIGARFGQAVALVAGALAVGAPRETVSGYVDAGAAYVYELTIDTWNQAAHLAESGGSLTDHRFGTAVAISGADASTPDRLIISSPSNAGIGYAGRVRSYTRTSGVWTARTVLQAPSSSSTDGWGCTLALDGIWAAIGQCGNGAVAANAGAVAVARFSSGFTSVDALSVATDAQGAANEYLGARIDIDRSGPSLIVGNAAAAMYGNAAQGVVLFGNWIDATQSLALTRTLDLGQGLSGARAAVFAADGDTLFVGAQNEDVGLQQERGAVYVYRRSGSQYVYESRLLAPDGMAGDHFGSRIALQGDVALVAAIGRTQGAIDAAGAVYAFRRDGGVWTLEHQFLPVAPGYENELGEGIAFDGTTAMISNRHDSTFVWQRSAAGAWTPVQTIDHVGWPVSLAGDSAMLAYFGADGDVGEVALYARSGGNWQAQGVLAGSLPGQGFGVDGSLAGDYYAVASNDPAIPVQLFRRTPGGWLPEASLLPDDATPDTYCWRVAMMASRLAIGCTRSGGNGAAYLFEKAGGLWAQQQKLTLPDARSGDAFAFSLGFGADGTLFAGAFGRDLDFVDQGAVYVYRDDVLFADGFD